MTKRAGSYSLTISRSEQERKQATIITTNLVFDKWGEIVKDKVLVAAMLDRLTHKAHLISMNGQSYRVKETEKMLSKIDNT